MLKSSYIVFSFVMPFTNTHTIFFSKINVDALEYERTPKNAPGKRSSRMSTVVEGKD